MAPIGNTVLSHVDGVSDSARARELYRYYQPTAPINQDTCFPVLDATTSEEEVRGEAGPKLINVQSDVTSDKISSPDTALTAFCQLVTWRLGVQRAMISLIDAETQYFVAESTKTVDLVDNTKHAPGDEIWMGCGSVTKAGRLCERTIETIPTRKANVFPSFIVNDLRADERFSELGFVTGSPFLRFYAGVPLITKRGIPIGSLFVVDDRVRQGLSLEDINFMGTMSETIMRHLEMTREVEEHRRGTKMSRGLASFVEGRAELAEADAEVEDGEGSRVAGQFETEPSVTRTASKASRPASNASRGASVVSVEGKEKEYSATMSKSESALLDKLIAATGDSESRPELYETSQSYDSTTNDANSPIVTGKVPQDFPDDMSETSTLRLLFSRAANLIREAFEVDGGVLFYDAQRGFAISTFQQADTGTGLSGDDTGRDGQTSGDDDLASAGESSHDTKDFGQRPTSSSGVSPGSLPRSPGMGPSGFSRSSNESRTPLELLGFSTSLASSIHGDKHPGPQCFQTLDNKAMNALLKRFPRGKMWTFESDGTVSSSSDDDSHRRNSNARKSKSKEIHTHRMQNTRNKNDAGFLTKHFPGVRQLLFVPLWDAGRSRWMSGCFVWSTEPTRVLSRQSELAFLSAFGDSVMAECSRIDTEVADQKKGDFIGSISHELRSPLHGILASAEFLGDEDLNSFQQGLVETIDSCGRTLLDTINHILDFSKINQFEKVWRKSKRSNRNGGRSSYNTLSLRKTDLPMVNLFADVDVSAICEEVVEGVFAGHVFQNMTAGNFDIVPTTREKMWDPKKPPRASEKHDAQASLQSTHVQLIFDVDVQAYNFVTQPGAFRRVIMNLLGNALKYTSHGYVHMTLAATSMEALHNPGTGEVVSRSLVTITVKDTGRGISADFLRSKVFTPFAQENSLSSGTGLGLSIVRSIVSLLEGEITIESEVGRGTDIRVTLPLLHDMPRSTDTGSSNTRSTASGPRESDEVIKNVRAQVIGRKVALHGFESDTPDPIVREMYATLKASVTNFLVNWFGLQVVPLGARTNLIISNEASPAAVLELARQEAASHRNTPTILVLCSQSARFERNISPATLSSKIGYVAKPVGPLKLAKAIMQCLEGAPPLITPSSFEPPYASPSITSNDLSNVFEELSFSKGGELLDNSRMAVDNENARKAIESPTPTLLDKHAEFPFPAPAIHDNRPKPHSMPASKEDLSFVLSPVSVSAQASVALTSMEEAATIGHISKPLTDSTPTIIRTPPSRQYAPSMLLVDDNKINLKLLTTYMRKKKYPIIHEAENGLEAVHRFAEQDGGYDIIFMDISMPILDGFGATKQIRNIERNRRLKDAAARNNLTENNLMLPSEDLKEGLLKRRGSKGEESKGESLIIALTGLASGRDQQEAANVGIDIFLTKPVSFKEVGRLLDNWEANRERDVESLSESNSTGGTASVPAVGAANGFAS